MTMVFAYAMNISYLVLAPTPFFNVSASCHSQATKKREEKKRKRKEKRMKKNTKYHRGVLQGKGTNSAPDTSPFSDHSSQAKDGEGN